MAPFRALPRANIGKSAWAEAGNRRQIFARLQLKVAAANLRANAGALKTRNAARHTGTPSRGNDHETMNAPSPLFDAVDAIYVINLPHRTDRRAEAEAELARAGIAAGDSRVVIFPAVRPEEKGAFPSIGARGCFMSHLGVIRDAAANGHGAILILEDDADFTRAFVTEINNAVRAIASAKDAALIYLGYEPDEDAKPAGAALAPLVAVDAAARLKQSHSIIMRRAAFGPVADYFEAMAARAGGDPKGGPMHVDGAYNWFRRAHPDMLTVKAAAPWAVQRASKTDIHDTGWKEKIPLFNAARRLRNWLAKR